jgi:hypothetical protein
MVGVLAPVADCVHVININLQNIDLHLRQHLWMRSDAWAAL